MQTHNANDHANVNWFYHCEHYCDLVSNDVKVDNSIILGHFDGNNLSFDEKVAVSYTRPCLQRLRERVRCRCLPSNHPWPSLMLDPHPTLTTAISTGPQL